MSTNWPLTFTGSLCVHWRLNETHGVQIPPGTFALSPIIIESTAGLIQQIHDSSRTFDYEHRSTRVPAEEKKWIWITLATERLCSTPTLKVRNFL
ncbi:hypothetical protein PM082_000148 [Marasmius tenuissimus]|nr:hypothetical protein PM082_000148 [Marasmius tenuissimus]